MNNELWTLTVNSELMTFSLWTFIEDEFCLFSLWTFIEDKFCQKTVLILYEKSLQEKFQNELDLTLSQYQLAIFAL